MSVTIGIISTSLLLVCLIIHFKCHFTFNICNGLRNITSLIIPRQSSLAFYPSLWTIYLSFLVILSVCIDILELLRINNRIIVWIICYGVILSSCWESLFSFHRYCTLKQYMNRSQKMKTKSILKKFIGFASIYILSFLSQLHFIYWLFPFVLAMYISFNIFWQYQFIQMLLKQYSTLSTIDTVAAANIQDQMIQSVYIMGYCSISSTIVSSLLVFSLSIFCPFDTNYIEIDFGDKMYNLVSTYFPMFWCCSSFFYMMNFVRNRTFFFVKFESVCIAASYFKKFIETFRTYNRDNNNENNNDVSSPSSAATPSSQSSPSDIDKSVSSQCNKSPSLPQSVKPIIAVSPIRTLPQSPIIYEIETTNLNYNKPNKPTSYVSKSQLIGRPSLCLAPPTSIKSDDFQSSEDIEHDYGDRLIMESNMDIKSKDTILPTHIPVMRRGYNSGITNVSIATDSSGCTPNSMLSPKRTNILDEKTEFVVPLSVIEDARNVKDGGDNNINNISTFINQNHSCSQISYSNGTNLKNEISYTSNTCNSVTNKTGTYYSTKSGKLSVVTNDDDERTLHSQVIISRVNNNNDKTTKGINRFFKTNHNKISKIQNKCRSLPVTPQEAIDSASSPSASTANETKSCTKHRTSTNEIIMGDLKMDNSVSFSINININNIHHGEHALSAPEEDISNHYNIIQQEKLEKVKNKSTALMDMMVNYGWTDQALLNSLQNLRRFSR